MSLIVGVHMGHDASLTVLRDGKVEFAISEERLTREKLYYGFPTLSLEYVFSQLDLSPKDVNILALDTRELPRLIGAEEMKRRFSQGKSKDIAHGIIKGKKILSYFLGKKNIGDESNDEREARKILWVELENHGFSKDKIRVYDHHQSHAASAFFASPYKEALVLTSDGRGDGLSATLGFASGEKLTCKHQISDLDSIGQFYAAVTFYLGFRPNRHEGKITGLAAHGNHKVLGSQFLENVIWNPDGSYHFRVPERYQLASYDNFDDFLKQMPLSLKDRIILHSQGDLSSLLYTANWYSLLAYLGDIAKGVSKENLAAGVQYLTEQVFCEFTRRNLPNRPIPVVLAGGVFANVRVNQKIKEISGVQNIYVQPAMGDQGLSLGAALLAYVAYDASAKKMLKEDKKPTQLDDVYLGPKYEDNEILGACQKRNIHPKKIEDIEIQIAQWINQGFIIGYYQGRMEFGPRALGHRSILARPTDKAINEELNNRLKRTEFMPFAPSAIAEHASEYFEGYGLEDVASEYMTVTYNVPKKYHKKIPAVVHVDGTARPQIVHKDKEPKYHKIIEEYYKLSGNPLIINTSFNTHEEPIVCTPEDAIRSYETNCVDILVMENYVLGLEKIK